MLSFEYPTCVTLVLHHSFMFLHWRVGSTVVNYAYSSLEKNERQWQNYNTCAKILYVIWVEDYQGESLLLREWNYEHYARFQFI